MAAKKKKSAGRTRAGARASRAAASAPPADAPGAPPAAPPSAPPADAPAAPTPRRKQKESALVTADVRKRYNGFQSALPPVVDQ